jgi:hypothetical protein
VHESSADLSRSTFESLDADNGTSGTEDTADEAPKVDGCKTGLGAGKLQKALERPEAETFAAG